MIIKVIEPSFSGFQEFEEAKKLGILLKAYLIQGDECDNFIIHRELSKDEEAYYKNQRPQEVLKYEGKYFLAGVSIAPTEKRAIKKIHHYWRAYLRLVRDHSLQR